ncbi:MAG: hypothetical protein K9M75_13045 [Phycisphaerae bacterium]|nr:hypothetical protein [Phycisphaerae bacterium]
MFRKFLDKLKKLSLERETSITSRFNDPIVPKTKWFMISKHGANFRTHNLKKVNLNRLEFKPTVLAILFFLAFFIPSIVTSIWFTNILHAKGASNLTFGDFAVLLCGILFAVFGCFLCHLITKPIVFDKQCGYFWKGRTAPNESINIESIEICCELETVYALQIISNSVRSQNDDYESEERCYEINLVLKNTERINVINNNCRETIRKEAQILADFLEKPLWDAT